MFPAQKRLNESEYGNDLSAVEKEYESHQREHKIIYQFNTNIDQCSAAEVTAQSLLHWSITTFYNNYTVQLPHCTNTTLYKITTLYNYFIVQLLHCTITTLCITTLYNYYILQLLHCTATTLYNYNIVQLQDCTITTLCNYYIVQLIPCTINTLYN